jgi:hypothetical protein
MKPWVYILAVTLSLACWILITIGIVIFLQNW